MTPLVAGLGLAAGGVAIGTTAVHHCCSAQTLCAYVLVLPQARAHTRGWHATFESGVALCNDVAPLFAPVRR